MLKGIDYYNNLTTKGKELFDKDLLSKGINKMDYLQQTFKNSRHFLEPSVNYATKEQVDKLFSFLKQ